MPSNDYDSIRVYLRFGFDPKTNDYKVVKLTGHVVPPSYAVLWWMDVEIYSMRKGTWELITQRFPLHITHIHDVDYVCADGHDGHLHCPAYYNFKGKTSKVIVAFDLGLETFRVIPLPLSTLDTSCSHVMGVLFGKLCVMSWDHDHACEVWVMEEYGVAESWVKHHKFSQFSDLDIIYGFTSHNEFLVVGDATIVLYDPIANKETKLDKLRFRRSYPDIVVEYVDSLVWVAPPG